MNGNGEQAYRDNVQANAIPVGLSAGSRDELAVKVARMCRTLGIDARQLGQKIEQFWMDLPPWTQSRLMCDRSPRQFEWDIMRRTFGTDNLGTITLAHSILVRAVEESHTRGRSLKSIIEGAR